MQCPNQECCAAVEEGVRVCPQCGTGLEAFVPPGPGEDDPLGADAPAQASRRRRLRTLANASVILAILSCPAVLFPILLALWSLLHRLLPPSQQGQASQPIFFAYLGAGIVVLYIMALSAIVTGHVAIVKGRRCPGTARVLWRPLFGTLLGYLTIALTTLLVLSALHKGRQCAYMATCGNNLNRIGMALRNYEEKNRGMFPPLSSRPGVLMFAQETIPPENDLTHSLTCPMVRYAKKGTAPYKAAHMKTPPFDDQSYFYLGYAVRSDEAVEAFAKAYRKKIAEGGAFDADLVVEDSEGTHVLHRLSEGVKEVLSAAHDRLSMSPYEGQGPVYQAPTTVCDDVPLLIERDLGHVDLDSDGGPRGAYVLYLNAGLQYVARGTWPITEKTQRILAELAE